LNGLRFDDARQRLFIRRRSRRRRTKSGTLFGRSGDGRNCGWIAPTRHVGQFVRQQTETFGGFIAPARRQRHIIADGHCIGAVCRRQATGILSARQVHRRRVDADRGAQETPIRLRQQRR
jgi:hypothetical protein